MKMHTLKEINRISEVNRYLSISNDLRKELQDIAFLASEICKVPISAITLLDEKINWISASYGTTEHKLPKETPFCHFAIAQDEVLVINDAKLDVRLKNDPAVQHRQGLRFYVGAPLTTSNGYKMGCLCLFDTKPGSLTKLQVKMLETLAKQAVFLMETEMHRKELSESVYELKQKNDSLRAIAQLQSHEIRQPLSSILGLINLAEDKTVEMDGDWIKMIKDVAEILDSKIHSIVNEAMGNQDIKLFRYNQMVEQIEDYAILLLDSNGKIENWNKGAAKIKGYAPSDVIGRDFKIFYTKQQQADGVPEHLLDIARKHGVARDEGPRVKKDGTEFLARVVITSIRNHAGELVGFTKVTRDITNEKPINRAVLIEA